MGNGPVFCEAGSAIFKTLCRPTKHVCRLPVCYFCLETSSLFSPCLLLSLLCKLTVLSHAILVEGFTATNPGILTCSLPVTFALAHDAQPAGPLSSFSCAWESSCSASFSPSPGGSGVGGGREGEFHFLEARGIQRSPFSCFA